jgi:hypothetical protein
MKIYKVGDLIRHVHEDKQWIWKIIGIDAIDKRYICELMQDAQGSFNTWHKGYRCTIHMAMASLIKSNNTKSYLPGWL